MGSMDDGLTLALSRFRRAREHLAQLPRPQAGHECSFELATCKQCSRRRAVEAETERVALLRAEAVAAGATSGDLAYAPDSGGLRFVSGGLPTLGGRR